MTENMFKFGYNHSKLEKKDLSNFLDTHNVVYPAKSSKSALLVLVEKHTADDRERRAVNCKKYLETAFNPYDFRIAHFRQVFSQYGVRYPSGRVKKQRFIEVFIENLDFLRTCNGRNVTVSLRRYDSVSEIDDSQSGQSPEGSLGRKDDNASGTEDTQEGQSLPGTLRRYDNVSEVGDSQHVNPWSSEGNIHTMHTSEDLRAPLSTPYMHHMPDLPDSVNIPDSNGSSEEKSNSFGATSPQQPACHETSEESQTLSGMSSDGSAHDEISKESKTPSGRLSDRSAHERDTPAVSYPILPKQGPDFILETGSDGVTKVLSKEFCLYYGITADLAHSVMLSLESGREICKFAVGPDYPSIRAMAVVLKGPSSHIVPTASHLPYVNDFRPNSDILNWLSAVEEIDDLREVKSAVPSKKLSAAAAEPSSTLGEHDRSQSAYEQLPYYQTEGQIRGF